MKQVTRLQLLFVIATKKFIQRATISRGFIGFEIVKLHRRINNIQFPLPRPDGTCYKLGAPPGRYKGHSMDTLRFDR